MNKKIILYLINIIIYVIILFFVISIFTYNSYINKSDESNSYDVYELDYNKNNLYHFYFKIDSDYLVKNDGDFYITKSETYCSSDCENLEDFSIYYNSNDNELQVKVYTYNNNNNNNYIYDYIDQDDYLKFDVKTLINTNIDLEINLILENNFIYLIVNNKLIEYREMDYDIKDEYSYIFTNIGILSDYKLYYDINNRKIDFKY